MNTISFAKGHGTENDFLIIDATVDPTEEQVRALCERRAGLGADGVLRVVRADADGQWFMDYRNADGSIAEMCGNGVRVFAHHLFASGLTEEMSALRVGTRAGVKIVSLDDVAGNRATVSVDMGVPVVLGAATAFLGAGRYAGVGVDMGNPHLACVLPALDADGLARLDLAGVPEVDTEMFPAGVNLEVVTPLAQSGAIHMRVIERGVGETRSCGTGTVAAAVAALADAGRGTGTVDVHVPGGTVTRQPGSSMKPYVLAASHEDGMPLTTTLDGSSPRTARDACATGASCSSESASPGRAVSQPALP